MTRKDYIKLADLLGAAYAHLEKAESTPRTANPVVAFTWAREAIHLVQTGIEDICRQDNPRFDRDRFQDAINGWALAPPRK